jgi:hypothetical protein
MQVESEVKYRAFEVLEKSSTFKEKVKKVKRRGFEGRGKESIFKNRGWKEISEEK